MRHVCDQVQAGKVGQVHTIKTVARDAPRPPTSYLKISGGIFHDCAVHDLGEQEFGFDLEQLLFRCLPVLHWTRARKCLHHCA